MGGDDPKWGAMTPNGGDDPTWKQGALFRPAALGGTHTLGNCVAYWMVCVRESLSQPALEQTALVPAVEAKS